MIFGIGTDIVQVSRMSVSLEKHGEKFARRILADKEFEEFQTVHAKASFVAKRFAAKEAAAKALGTGFIKGLSLKHIAVDHDSRGKPELVFSGIAKEIFDEQQLQASHISIADEKEFAVAYVVLEK